MSYPWIKASEIADYCYCRRGWWLRRMRGVAPVNVARLAAGTRHHERHGRLVQRSIWAQRVAYIALFCAVAALVFFFLSS